MYGSFITKQERWESPSGGVALVRWCPSEEAIQVTRLDLSRVGRYRFFENEYRARDAMLADGFSYAGSLDVAVQWTGPDAVLGRLRSDARVHEVRLA